VLAFLTYASMDI